MPIQKIDKSIINRYGSLTIPPLKSIKICRIKELPEKILEIRKHRTGPKLLLGENAITTEFKSGFYGPIPTYVEQLFIVCKNSSHEKITDLFSALNNSCMVSQSALEAVKKVEAELNVVSEWITSRDEKGCEFFKKSMLNLDRTQSDPEKVTEARELVSKWYVERREAAYKKIYQKIQADIEAIFKVYRLDGTKSDCPSVLDEVLVKEKIIAVWFIAETFRHPPMIFYSLILLYLFINKYIGIDKLRELYPAYKQGSQAVLVSAFTKQSQESEQLEVTVKKSSEVTDKCELEDNKFQILQLFYDCVSKPTMNTIFGKDYAGNIFKEFCKGFLNLCGIDTGNNHEIMISLDNLVNKFQSNESRSSAYNRGIK